MDWHSEEEEKAIIIPYQHQPANSSLDENMHFLDPKEVILFPYSLNEIINSYFDFNCHVQIKIKNTSLNLKKYF